MFLPLHAAGNYQAGKMDCCADYVVSSYTPTLTALLRAQNSNLSFRTRKIKLRLVAVTKTLRIKTPILWHVKKEVDHVRAAAEKARLTSNLQHVDDAALVTRVAEAFKDANMVHIACHGIQNRQNALSSGFCLSDGNLTVSQLMDLDLKDAIFAFLSACETAKGDEKQPDQTVHLAAAMLFIGFRSVVATMW
jgi:CHAT domain-containing protein